MSTHDSRYQPSAANLDETTEHALVALLWSETYYASEAESESGNGTPFDSIFDTDDVTPETRAALRAELSAFITDDDNSADLDGMRYDQIGHDFILTRNGHGAGFWDRGLGARGTRLTAMCKPYGTLSAYSNDGETVGAE